MNSRRRWAAIATVLMLVTGIDQATKFLAKAYLPDHELSYLGGAIVLLRAYNRGAFLSLGASLPDAWRTQIFIFGVAVVLAALLLYTIYARDIQPRALLALSLAFAGGVSNLIDRIFLHHGLVFDFLNVGIGGLRTGIFNVADMMIMLGLALLLIPSRTARAQAANERAGPA
jgi:signal peptidase II